MNWRSSTTVRHSSELMRLTSALTSSSPVLATKDSHPDTGDGPFRMTVRCQSREARRGGPPDDHVVAATQCDNGQLAVTQRAYDCSCHDAPVATTSTALAFQRSPVESGKFWLIDTLFAPLPVTCAPPPTTRFPDGHVATTALELEELDEVAASTRWRPLIPGDPFGPGTPRGPAGP